MKIFRYAGAEALAQSVLLGFRKVGAQIPIRRANEGEVKIRRDQMR